MPEGKLFQISQLYLAKNKLKALPDIFGLTGLQKLSLRENCLEKLEESFCSLQSLKKLFLDSNFLRELPERFGDLKALEDRTAELRFTGSPDMQSLNWRLSWPPEFLPKMLHLIRSFISLTTTYPRSQKALESSPIFRSLLACGSVKALPQDEVYFYVDQFAFMIYKAQ
eukprot:g860.t1